MECVDIIHRATNSSKARGTVEKVLDLPAANPEQPGIRGDGEEIRFF